MELNLESNQIHCFSNVGVNVFKNIEKDHFHRKIHPLLSTNINYVY